MRVLLVVLVVLVVGRGARAALKHSRLSCPWQ